MPIFRLLKRWFVPRSLMARLQVLLVLPVLIVIAVNSYIFFERHWHEVQLVLVRSVVREIALLINHPAGVAESIRLGEEMELRPTFTPGARLGELRRQRHTTDDLIAAQMRALIPYPFDIDTGQEGKRVYLWVELPDGLLKIDVHRKRVESFTIRLMVGFVLLSMALVGLIAALFMRKQIQPLLALTRHIQQRAPFPLEKGSGSGFPKLHEKGAREVRELTRAFMRFQRQQSSALRERTEMLHGISHDLRTPLTRMKLQLAMLESVPEEIASLSDEIDLMSHMLEHYLAFIEHNVREERVRLSAVRILNALSGRWQQSEKIVFPDAAARDELSALMVSVRPNLLGRAFDNVLENAVRHAERVWVLVEYTATHVQFVIRDDGPGIPENERKHALEAFSRLDAARRRDTGGSGLGLTLVRKTLLIHEGGLHLDSAPEGGLQVTLSLPLIL